MAPLFYSLGSPTNAGTFGLIDVLPLHFRLGFHGLVAPNLEYASLTYLKRPKRCFFTQIFGLAYFSYVFSFHRSFFIIHQRPKYARKRRMRQRKEGTSFLSLVRSADLADRR